MPHLQDQVQALSVQDPETFWTRHAEHLHWHKRPPSGVTHAHWAWFPDGKISTSYNCVDRHVKNGNGSIIAIIWDSPVIGVKEKYTYSQLLLEVETLAGVLRQEGVRKGDVVLVYSQSTRYDPEFRC